MSRKLAARTERTRPSLGRRVLLAAGVIALGLFSVSDSLANAVASRSPQLAHKLAPWNGRIEARLARRGFEARPTGDTRSASARHAKNALAKEPTAVEALSVLALQAQLRGDEATSRAMLAHGLTLSQRELPSRLWAIQEAALRGDLQAVIRHYDIALKTSNAAAPRLFPILAQALSEPRIRAAVVQLFTRHPVWREDFISYAARESSDPVSAAALFGEAAVAGVPINPDMQTALVDSFAEAGQIDGAWRYYRRIRSDAPENRSRDPEFRFTGERRSLFDWNASTYATIQRSGASGLLDFSVPSATTATLATQALLLAPGRYVLRGLSRGVTGLPSSRPYFILRCGDEEIGRVALPASGERQAPFSGAFTVVAGCPLHTLALVAPATDDYSGSAGQVLRVELRPQAAETGSRR